ncbi:MAG: YjfB family protein [Fibromonadaceae bacterium]|jgi:hypothetical protein|nr:YjfB family protein [Fibromonadaceae bacterium]
MEMDIAKLATAQKATQLNNAVGIAVLKQAQQAAEQGALTLLQAMPQAPPAVNGIGQTVDVSV